MTRRKRTKKLRLRFLTKQVESQFVSVSSDWVHGICRNCSRRKILHSITHKCEKCNKDAHTALSLPERKEEPIVEA